MEINELFKKLKTDMEFMAKYRALDSLWDWLAEAEKDGCAITAEAVGAILQKARSGELFDE